jgi:hypothetical protein
MVIKNQIKEVERFYNTNDIFMISSPIILNQNESKLIIDQNVSSMEDNYNGDFTERRNLIYTLDFTAKTYLFGAVGNGKDSLIKQVQVDYHSDTNRVNSSRQLRYIADPRAIKDYNHDETTVIAQDINELITKFEVSDASGLVTGTYIMIDSEEMYIKDIVGNVLTVTRGQDNSSPAVHALGTALNIITQSDDDLIAADDDFGFNEYRYDFADGKIYSTTKGVDV